MDKTGWHPGLEARLTALALRIGDLRHKMNQAEGAEKIEASGEIGELERRYQLLDERRSSLNREGPGMRQDVKAELERVVDDLKGTIEDFIMWIDSGCHPDHRPNVLPKS